MDGVKALHCASSTTVVDSKVTDEAGNYCFNDVASGDYRVQEVSQQGWTNTTASFVDLTVNPGDALSVNFGNQSSQLAETGSICGYKFNDTDRNGLFDNEESGIGQWKIFASSTDFLSNTLTNDAGLYCFSGLNPATYQVFEEIVSGWNTTTAATTTVDLAAGQGVSNVNFGNVQVQSTECTPDQQQSCSTEGVGICGTGVQTCDQTGHWGACVANQPSAEICDGLDNNCNGQVDEGNVCSVNTTSSSGGGGGGGGGGGIISALVIHDESIDYSGTTATIHWFTNVPATSRVVYDTASVSAPSTPPNYGYGVSTVTSDTGPMVTYHTVVITGLTPQTIHYFRPVSSIPSIEVYGIELSNTLTAGGAAPSGPTGPGNEGQGGGAGETGTGPAGGGPGPAGGLGGTGGGLVLGANNNSLGKIAGVETSTATTSPEITATSTPASAAQTGGTCTTNIWILIVLNALAVIGLAILGRKNPMQFIEHAWWATALLAGVPVIIWYPVCWLQYWLIATLVLAIIGLIVAYQKSGTSKAS